MRGRLTLWQTAALALVLVLGASTAYVFFRALILERVDRSLANTAETFVQSLTSDRIVPGEEDAAVRDGLDEFRFRDLSIVVYDQNLHVIGVSTTEPVRHPDARVGPLPPPQTVTLALRALRRGHTTARFVRLSGQHEVYRLYVMPITVGRKPYVLAIVQSLDEERELLRRTKTTVAITIPMILLIAGLGGAFLADRSLAPVAAMTAHAARIGVANSSERLPVHNPHDELGQLARVFNELLGRLHDTLDRQRQFMADASHELRTPIAVIQAEVDVTLTQESRCDREYRETLATIGMSARRLSAVINNLFLLARADAGQYPIARAPTYLTDIVSESVKALRTVAEQRDIRISVELPNDDVPYEGDIELLHRLVTNLVENALKHGTPHTTATVVFEVFPTEYVIRVMNQALDIPLFIQRHIFDRFVQSSTSLATTELRDRGAGLGLPIAQWIAQVHGGRVELLWSREGTTAFQCSLPRHVG